jgi:hypothetical protein
VVTEVADRDAVLAAAAGLLRERFRVEHATLQLEGVAAACGERPAELRDDTRDGIAVRS